MNGQVGGRGFTLIELLTVLTIVSLVVSLTAPGLFSAVRRTQALVEVGELRSLLQGISTRAWVAATPVRVVLEGDGVELVPEEGGNLGSFAGQRFEHLEFGRQELLVNRNGFPDRFSVEVLVDGRQLELDLTPPGLVQWPRG